MTLRVFLGVGVVFVEFSHKHTVGGFSVAVGPVCREVVFHVSSAIELVGCGKVSAFHLVEYGLCVDEAAF